MLSAPCWNCEERFSGCHSVCEKYKSFKVKDAELKKKKMEFNKQFREIDAFRKSMIKKNKRNKR